VRELSHFNHILLSLFNVSIVFHDSIEAKMCQTV